MKILFSKRCLEYSQPGHPESPQRVASAHRFLEEKGYEFIEPKPCKDEDLLGVHTEEFIGRVRNGEFFDLDTPNLPGVYDYAKLSAGAAIEAMWLALKGERAFSLMRPPGHHANQHRVGGFCYFNNIAISCKKALDSVVRVAIIDVDCHHGNGTQDIFMGDQRVLYVSLHQSPLYPGTGLSSVENCLNYPLYPGAEEEEYLRTLKEALAEVKKFDPNLVGVSAGFDTYHEDPVTNLGLEKSSFQKIGQMIAYLGKPTFVVLEGGYGDAFPECVWQFLLGYEE